MDEEFLSKTNLLYVEDNESIRTALGKRLKIKVKNLYVAKDGQEGLEKFKKYKPDLVLTDITMPKMSGIQMSREIKAIDEKIPIIVISAHNDSSFLLEAIDIGINGYLLKPINIKKLFDSLEEKIRPYFLEKELIEQRKKMLYQSRFALLGEMVSMLSHQWRQPLSMITLTLSNIKLKFSLDKYDVETKEGRENLPERIEKDFKNVEDKVYLLSNILDQFATFYKPSDGISTIHINSTIQETVKNFANTIQGESITINEYYNSDKYVKVYKDIFMQICMNLLNNSNEKILTNDVKNPIITITSNNKENEVEIIIEDNAGRISEDIIDKIFDPYFSTKFARTGNGLGLYMSKLVIEEHLDGKIFVENTNNGVKFTIILKEVL